MVVGIAFFDACADHEGNRPKELSPSRPNFPWYSFPNVVTPEVMVQWNDKLAWLRERIVHIPAEINWDWMEEVGLSDAL